MKSQKKPLFIIPLALLMLLFVACGNREDRQDPSCAVNYNNQEQNRLFPQMSILFIPSYNVTLNIRPLHCRAEDWSAVDFINTSMHHLDSIYSSVLLNSFRENSQFSPFFKDFEGRIFRHYIKSPHNIGYMNGTATPIDLTATEFSTGENILDLCLFESLSYDENDSIGLVF